MAEGKGDRGGFEDRLRAARQRQGLEPTPSPPAGESQGPSPLALALRVGVELLSALLVGVAIGWGLDRWLHTRPVFLAVFVVLGGVAGVANVWRLVGPMRGPPAPPAARQG